MDTPSIIRSGEKLMKLAPPPHSLWNIFAYIINEDVNDPMKAIIFPLGGYSTEEQAHEKAKAWMIESGHPYIMVCPFGMPAEITLTPNVNIIREVIVDTEGKLIN